VAAALGALRNGAYRVHPTEWNIGESAGVLAAYCHTARLTPAAVRSTKLGDLQTRLRAQGVQTTWPTTVRSQWLRPPQA
jgi:hypothetical protein